MFLVVRHVSGYTEWDPVFLGVFTDADRAEAARKAYIASTRGNDPWQKQAYHTPDLDKDVTIAPLDGDSDVRGASSVFLVTRHLEGMGQVSRWYLAAYASLEDANRRADSEANEQPVILEYLSIEEIVLDDTRYFTHSPFKSFGVGLWTGRQPGE